MRETTRLCRTTGDVQTGAGLKSAETRRFYFSSRVYFTPSEGHDMGLKKL